MCVWKVNEIIGLNYEDYLQNNPISDGAADALIKRYKLYYNSITQLAWYISLWITIRR